MQTQWNLTFKTAKRSPNPSRKQVAQCPWTYRQKLQLPQVRHQSQIKAHLSLKFHIPPGQVKISIQEHNFID